MAVICDILIPGFIQDKVCGGNHILGGNRGTIRKTDIGTQMKGPVFAG